MRNKSKRGKDDSELANTQGDLSILVLKNAVQNVRQKLYRLNVIYLYVSLSRHSLISRFCLFFSKTIATYVNIGKLLCDAKRCAPPYNAVSL